MKTSSNVSAPAPSALATAVCQGLTGRSPAPGFSLIEVMLVLGGLSLLSAGGFIVYQGAANNANVKTEQDNVQKLANNADRIYGALGSYQNVTTARAVADKIPPTSMVSGSGLLSRWSEPVVVAPVAIGTRANAGLKITYQAVPARACLKFARAASEGMFDVEVDGVSVLNHGRFNTDQAITRCNQSAATPVVFTYHAGTTGLAGEVLPPVSLPPLNPPSTPPPVAPPPAPPPATPPPPPASPGCGTAPSGAATGTTPAGQTCSFIWNSVAAPTCWAPMALCAPTIAPPPVAPPPATPPPGGPPVAPPPGSPLCSAPSPSTRLCAAAACVDGTDGSVDTVNNGTFACPAGQVITTPGAYQYASSAPRTRTQTVTRNETASCPDPFGAVRWTASTFNPATYGPWNQTFTCAPSCVAPADTTQSQAGAVASQAGPPETAPGAVQSQAGAPDDAAGANQTQTLACPAGQSGAITQSRTTTIYRTTTQTRSSTIARATTQTRPTTQTRTVTYDCPAPVGAFTTTYGAWSAPGAPYGAWSAATPSGAWSAPQAPYGAWSAPGAPHGAWGAPGAPYGAWGTTGNTCTPIAPPGCPGGMPRAWQTLCNANENFCTNSSGVGPVYAGYVSSAKAAMGPASPGATVIRAAFDDGSVRSSPYTPPVCDFDSEGDKYAEVSRTTFSNGSSTFAHKYFSCACTAPPPPPGPPPGPSGGSDISCTKSYRYNQPPAAFRIIGYFSVGDTYNTTTTPDHTFANPSDWSVSWVGLPVGGAYNVPAKPFTNPQPNSLYVDATCSGNAEWGYRATYTKTSTGQTYNSTFSCRCTNLGL